MIINSEFSRLLKRLRGDESLRDVAQRAELSHTYLGQLEAGTDKRTGKIIKPSADTLMRLSKAYNYPYEKFLTAAGYLDSDDNDHDSDLQPTPRDRVKVFQKKLGDLSPESMDFLEFQLDRLRELDLEAIERKKAERAKKK